MSGHSKWSQIKRQKGVNDAKRGQLFTKLGREISVAARQGGADLESNFRLRLAVQRARDNNMPMENIDRAIKRGTGGGESAALEEILYEGYGPGGVAVMVDILTDNRNRTAAEIRNIFTRAGGSLGESGCVAWQFSQRGNMSIEVKGADPDELALRAIDAGALDVKTEDGTVEIFTEPSELESVRKAIEGDGVAITSAEVTMVPETTIELDSKVAGQVFKLLDRLEEQDDVQRVYSNAEFSQDVLEEYGA
ncbi:MAG: YebC/PmpR family DNA-binding transcriptional regulator [Chloroflexi bacterium]|nr:YebC/PmpR family DNA-binding transcriptional regulator [Chloroflexota bacterium]